MCARDMGELVVGAAMCEPHELQVVFLAQTFGQRLIFVSDE
jgi:hypothetical protein